MVNPRRTKRARKSPREAVLQREREAVSQREREAVSPREREAQYVAATLVRRTVKREHDSDDSDDSTDNEVFKPKRSFITNKIKDRCDYDIEYYLPPKEVLEEKMPFCCAICHCSEELRSRAQKLEPEGVVFQDMDHLWHRICCHRAFDFDEDWVCPYVELSLKAMLKPEKVDDKPTLEWVRESDIYTAYLSAKSQESQIYNADGEVLDIDKFLTNENYIPAIEQPYKTLVEARMHEKPRRAVVLDCFAGVGTSIVALKRLCIDISKVVHVEHDKVATHVYRYNHDHDYNPALPQDDIQHVFFEKFEELDLNLEVILALHGPFDIVVGGPPCSDFSKVNAFRGGVDGQQGQYMLDFGRLIRKLERLQYPHPLMFLAENVPLQGDDLVTAQQAFELSWDPVEFDALYVSPTRRRRVFFTNIPLRFGDFDFQGVASELGPSSCLEVGYSAPAHIVAQEDNTIAKINCLMASPTRIDERSSLRMYVFENSCKKGKYHGRPLKCFERENVMGYPRGYVETPVVFLFKELHVNGLHCQYREDASYEKLRQESWKVCLPKKYHHFAGNYHQLPVKDPYRLKLLRSSPIDVDAVDLIQIKMAPPLPNASSTPTFYLDEEYVKHLIGNAFSVPVVELLFGPLKSLFGTRLYQNYEYNYAWYDAMQILLYGRSKKQAVNNLCTVSIEISNEELSGSNQDDCDHSINKEVQEEEENTGCFQLCKVKYEDDEVLDEEV